MDPKLLGIIGVACYLSAVTIGGLMVHWIDRRFGQRLPEPLQPITLDAENCKEDIAQILAGGPVVSMQFRGRDIHGRIHTFSVCAMQRASLLLLFERLFPEDHPAVREINLQPEPAPCSQSA